MKCYIYKIINQITGEKYVGQTTNFSRRINDHKKRLRNKEHPNAKLQNAWNKYGEDNFYIEKEEYDLTPEELDLKEIEIIQKEDSYYNGYNLTLGGDYYDNGKLSFDEFCMAYFGNLKYKQVQHRTAIILNVDDKTISNIVLGKSYARYRDKALSLSLQQQEEYIKMFEDKLKLKQLPPAYREDKLDIEDIICWICTSLVYGRGIDKALSCHFNKTQGLTSRIKKGSYKYEYEIVKQKTKQEIEEIAINCFENNNLQQYCTQKIKKNKEIIFSS